MKNEWKKDDDAPLDSHGVVVTSITVKSFGVQLFGTLNEIQTN